MPLRSHIDVITTTMELAGLEPATSWVRFGRRSSPSLAMVGHLRQSGRFKPGGFADGSHVSSLLLDQNLTTNPRRWRKPLLYPLSYGGLRGR